MQPQRNYKYDNEGDLCSIYRNYKVAMYKGFGNLILELKKHLLMQELLNAIGAIYL
jgi:hypothetical protein